MKKVFILLTLLLLMFQGNLLSQTEMHSASQKKIDSLEVAHYLQPGKLKMNVEFGTMFIYSAISGGGFDTYLSPRVTYPLGSKFSLHSGLQINMFSYNPSMSREINTQKGFTSTLLYAGGSYRLHENLTLSGTAFKDVSNLYRELPNSMGHQPNYQGVFLGVDYKLGRNLFIQGQIEISNGSNQHWFNPMLDRTFPGYQPFRQNRPW